MARPKVNVEIVDGDVLRWVKDTFRTKGHAYRQLGLQGSVDIGVFNRAWWGKPVAPGVRAKIDCAWVKWVRRVAEKFVTDPERLAPYPQMERPVLADRSVA